MKLSLGEILPLLILFVVLALVFLLRWLIPARKHTYQKAEAFLSPAELRFFRILAQAVEPDFRVFCKVRLCDIITPTPRRDRQHWWASFCKISQKHVDFLLCDGQNGTALGVIELDDSSHNRPDRKKRDAFVDEALRQGGIPIVHMPVKTAYQFSEIEGIILKLFPPTEKTAALPLDESRYQPPAKLSQQSQMTLLQTRQKGTFYPYKQ